MGQKLILSKNVLEWLDKNTDKTYHKKNMYVCNSCQRHVITIDSDRGVTPFMMGCLVTEGCIGIMHSTFYGCDQSLEPTYEWYRPETIDYPENEDYVTHLMNGGLVIRPIQQKGE